MSATLVFECRSATHQISQEGEVERAPMMELKLELTEGPVIYLSDASRLNAQAWKMNIREHCGAARENSPIGEITYFTAVGKPQCLIDVYQSSQRYFLMLEMFKGGYVSEITIGIDEVCSNSDYSKTWDTAANEKLAIRSINFEFPLPQSDA